MPEAIQRGASPKIHFAVLLGVHLDADLVPYFIAHYRPLCFDTYTVFLHLSKDSRLNVEVASAFADAGYIIIGLPEDTVRTNPILANEPGIGVRSVVMEKHAKALPRGDYLVTADSDELQKWTEEPRALLDRGIGLLTGELIDCFDDTLHGIDPLKTLDENYPGRALALSRHWREFPFDYRKIVMAPTWYPINYSGSHTVERNLEARIPFVPATGPIEVLHYRWRHNALARVHNRPGWPEDEIARMKKFFGMEVTEK